MEMLVRDLLAFTKVNRIDISSAETDAGEALSAALANLERAIAESNATVTSDALRSLCGRPVCVAFVTSGTSVDRNARAARASGNLK